MQLRNTPVDEVEFLGHQVYVKRDDLLDVAFTGNKARKFYHFLQQDLSQVDILVGHGSAQANSLYSLAVLAQLKQCQLHYYVDHLPQYLIDNPQGNYRAALAYGAQIIVVGSESTVIEHIEQQALPALVDQGLHAVFIPEGGRCQYAEAGLKILADEIMAWAKAKSYADIRVVLPAGTGTTAYFYRKTYLLKCKHARVWVGIVIYNNNSSPCVLMSRYIREYFALIRSIILVSFICRFIIYGRS